MIDPAGRLHNPASAERIVSDASRTEPPGTQSFADELSDRLAGTLQNRAQTAGLPASPPAGQRIVNWRVPGGSGPSAPSSTSGTAAQPSGLNGLVITYPGTTSGAAESAEGAGTQTSSETSTSFDDAYWAQQPAAVQQLRDMQNPEQRAQVGEQLAQEGYTIDVPIMVWGWDPATTTAARESMGYTWVPSANQQPLEVAPGLTFDGTSYNPANPPAGSIMV